MLALVFILSVTADGQLVKIASADDPTTEVNLFEMNFHMYSLVYSNSNSSILIYNGADTNPPTYADPVTGQVSCSVRQSAQIWFAQADVWLGGVSWITQPLAEDVTIQGNVSMTVWMSTPDQETLASGYAFGLSEVDSMANPIGDPSYQYYYSLGSVLTPSRAPFQLAFTVNRTFTKGNILGFFVIVGSATEGWRYQVYFDSPSINSFAELPVLGVAIPEFSQAGLAISMTLAMLCSYAVVRRKK